MLAAKKPCGSPLQGRQIILKTSTGLVPLKSLRSDKKGASLKCSEFLSLIPSYSHVNVRSRARYIHNSAQGQRGAGSRFRRAIAPSTPTPRNLPRPLWPVRCGGFLIANPRLKIFASPTKQSIGAKSNRERIAFPLYHLPPCRYTSLVTHHRFSNSNIRTIRNSPKCRRNNTYAFSKRNKTGYSEIFPGSLPAAGGLQMRPVSLSKMSSSRVNRLESEGKWQSPLRPFALHQSPAKISSTPLIQPPAKSWSASRPRP